MTSLIPLKSMTQTTIHNLHDLTRPEIVALLNSWGYSEFHAGVLWDQLYKQLAGGFETITILRDDLKEHLLNNATLTTLDVSYKVQSVDGLATKYLFLLGDGETVESVLMYYAKRATACISTQVGCAMGCVFCATGQMGFIRHLRAGEIVGQLLHIARQLDLRGERLRNVVLMGMGEPLHNYTATMKAIEIMTEHHGLSIGPRYITLSTVGIPSMIRRIADENRMFNLAVSLHAATDDERNKLVPTGKNWSLIEIMNACRYYIDKLDRRVFFEWALIEGKNDTPQQAHAVGRLLQNMNAHVNLIPLNLTHGYGGNPSSRVATGSFQAILADYGLPSTIRQRRGIDINAGCGQLRANKER